MWTFQHVPCQVKCWLCLDISCCALLLPPGCRASAAAFFPSRLPCFALLRLVGFIAGVPMGAPACFFCAEMVGDESDVVDASVTHWATTDEKTCHVLLCSGKGLLILLDVNRILIIQQAVELCFWIFWTGVRLSLPSRASEGLHATGNHRGPCSFGRLGSNGSTPVSAGLRSTMGRKSLRKMGLKMGS